MKLSRSPKVPADSSNPQDRFLQVSTLPLRRKRAELCRRTPFRFQVSSSSPSAFTLAEMLVSISVLLLLIVLVTQLLGSATKVTTSSRNHMDTDAQARLVFDRMATDFGSMLKRKDVDYVFTKTTGNDSLFFYSEAPAYFAGSPTALSPVALIGYRINPTTFQLERLGKGLSWDGASSGQGQPGSVVFLTYPAHDPAITPTPTPFAQSTISANWADSVAPASTDTDFHVISDQVYRLEFCFLKKDGTYMQPAASPATFDSANIGDISGIVITIAILDNNSRKIVSPSSSIPATMPTALADPTDANLAATPPILSSKTWTDAVTNNGFAKTSGIPQLAASQVRIYQRTFFLNNTNDL